MNKLLLTKKRVQKANRLHEAQLVTFRKGIFTNYKPSVFKKQQLQACKEVDELIS